MIKYSVWLFQIFHCKASSSNWQHLFHKKACTAFFRHTASVIHFRQTSTFMNKNVPNITNTDDVLTGITRLKAFECLAQSPVTHVQLLFGLCGSLTQKSGKVSGSFFYKASNWLEKGAEQQDIQSMFVGTNPSQWELKVTIGEPGAAQVSSLLEKEGKQSRSVYF